MGRSPRTALVTGASSGIGRHIARFLVGRGYRVIGVARRLEHLERAVRDWSHLPGTFEPLVADLTSDAGLASVLEVGEREPIDILVNNAGIGWYAPQHSIPFTEQHRLIETNLQVPLALMRGTLPGMRRRGRGTIVNVASAAGAWSLPGFGVYAASKMALIAASEAAWNENRRRGVHVGVVIPGPVDTPFMSDPRTKGGRRNITGPFKVHPRAVVGAVERILRQRTHRVYVPWYHGPLAWLAHVIPGFRRYVVGGLSQWYVDHRNGSS